MHWVWATDRDGNRVPVNLAAVCSMMRGKTKVMNGAGLVEMDVTMLFLGGVAIQQDGSALWANTQVRETPDELFAMKPIEVGPKDLHPSFKALIGSAQPAKPEKRARK